MTEIQNDLNEIHKRFVKGILKGLNPAQLHAYVTGAQTATRKAS